MTRSQLDHILRAAGAITDESELAAGREKDLTFVTAMLRNRMVLSRDVESLAAGLPKSICTIVLTNLRICHVQSA